MASSLASRTRSAIKAKAKRRAAKQRRASFELWRETGFPTGHAQRWAERHPERAAEIAGRNFAVREAKRRGLQAGTAGGEAALGKSQSYETPAERPLINPVSKAVYDQRQMHRWAQLRGLRQHSTKKRVRRCKRPIGQGRVGLVAHQGGAHYTGLESCANVWACPMCAPKIRAGRMSDVLLAFERHEAAGGGFAFLTITVQHDMGDRLADVLGLLQEAWTYVTRQRDYKELRHERGLVGNIAALEVTDGQNGWHPHKHIMFFTERPLTKDEVRDWESKLDELYGRYLDKRGWTRGRIGVGVRLDYVTRGAAGRAKLAKYVTKIQAGFELTRADLKASRAATGKGALPFDRLDQAMAGDEAALARWQEYERAMTGKSAVRFSKGLRARLDMDDAKTDEELAAEEVGGEAGLYLSAPLYRRIFWNGEAAEVLLAYGDGGDAAVLRFVHDRYGGEFSASDEATPGGVLLLE